MVSVLAERVDAQRRQLQGSPGPFRFYIATCTHAYVVVSVLTGVRTEN